MTDITPSVPHEPTRFSVVAHFGLVETGVLTERDRVELLEGVIVAMTPMNPPHAGPVTKLSRALFATVGARASVRTQCPLILRPRSVPEPDVAVVAGCDDDYFTAHPESALLVVEMMRDPDPAAGLYRELRTLRGGDRIDVASLPGASIEVGDLLPRIAPDASAF